MKISKKSWHYRLLTGRLLGFIDSQWNPNPSLCTYFWQVVLRLVQSAFVAFAVTSPISAILAAFGLYPSPEKANVLISGHVVLGVVTSVVGLALGLVGVGVWVYNKLPKDEYRYEEDKEPSLVYNYIKAKKERICPILEFKND